MAAQAQSTPYPINVFPTAPRELRQFLARAEAAIEEERYSDAVQELSQILNTPDSDDFFLTAGDTPEAQSSLKTQALELLGSMPAKGRQFYELHCGADAKQALAEALNAGDLIQLTEVCRRYFHTKAGYEATLLLARIQLDQGRPLAAALTLKRVADVPQAVALYDPELSVLLATAWYYADRPQAAREILVALKQRLPQAKIRLVGREVAIYDRDESALDWLKGIVGASRNVLLPAVAEWVVYRGDEKRNAESTGGLPLLNFTWKLPTVNDPPDEAKVGQLYRAARDRGELIIPALQPLVVQDYAILRQPESNKLVGINLKKNGKREWVFPPFDENLAVQQAARQTNPSSRSPTTNVRENELKQRIWEDHTFGQIASDGKQVYVIDDLGFAESPNFNPPRVIIQRGGRGVLNSSGAKPTNKLVALDLVKQGYQLWAVGGADGEDNPQLAGAFFLGPPLPAGDQLYALAEFAGEIRLLCLNPRTGGLEWKQQLAILEEQLHIVNDRQRRLAGASSSLADGILICPTSSGAIVAVDLATRTLRWGYQFGRSDVMLQQQSRFGVRMAVPTNESGRWLDGTATIADGCVILTPVESQQLHCLDLLTGKAKWDVQPRDDMLFVGCVHAGKIILVGKDKMKAVKLVDGTTAWTSDLKLGGDLCAGRGYYSDKHYYLPVTGQQLLKIDLESGLVVAKAQTEVELGNVVCYQTQLISQSPQTVSAFVLLSEQLEKQLDQRLAANADDVDALSLKAQISLQEGNAEESLQLLRRANELAPTRSALRGLLVKVILSLLRQDFDAHVALTDELDKLVSDPAQRREVLRWRVQALARSSRTWEAFQSLLELADHELAEGGDLAADDLAAFDRELRVRPDRWLQGQLQRLWQAADSETRERMSAEIEVRVQRAVDSGSASQLRNFLNFFGSYEVSYPARLALAEKLIATDAWLEAELVLGPLLKATKVQALGAARAVLASLYEKAKRPELAAREYQALGGQFRDVVCREGMTGGALATRAAQDAALAPYFAALWPVGQVEVKESDGMPTPDRMMAFQRLNYAVPIMAVAGLTPAGLRASYDPQQNVISLRGEFGQALAAASLRATERRYYYAGANNGTLSAVANGHLVVVNMGAELAAVDGLRGPRGEGLLWRQDTLDMDPTVQRNIYPQQRVTNNPLAGTRYVSYDPSGRINFSTAPALSMGFCFQRGRQLICADPLTGQSLWERNFVPQQAEIFGDEELVFVADAKGDETLVLSAIDGSLVGKRKLEPADRRWTTHGRRVLAWEQAAATIKVRLYDAWKQGADLWSRQVPTGSRACLIDADELAVLEPGGQFTIVSLATGAVRFAVPLEPEPTIAWIQVVRTAGQYLLMVSQQESNEPQGGILVQPLSSAGNQQTRLHGRVYAFQRGSGKLQWPVPAFVSHHCLPADQPVESPFLLFVRNRTDTNRTSAPTKASVLALNRRDGRIVFESDNCGGTANSCEIVADPAKQNVSLTLYSQTAKSFVFQLTNKPMPPEPPGRTGVAASDANEPAGAVDRTVGAAIEMLRRRVINSSPVIPPNPDARGPK